MVAAYADDDRFIDGALEQHTGLILCTRGAAAVEFALVLPVLIIVLMGLVEMGLAFMTKVQVQAAVQAGVVRAERTGFDIPLIQSAVTSSTGLATVAALPVPTESCACISGTTINPATCGSTCSSGIKAGTYVTVNAQATYTPLFNLIYTTPVTFIGTAESRIK